MRIENDLIHEAATRQLNLDEYKELLIILSNTPKNCLIDSLSSIDLIKILSFMDFEDEEISDIAERIAKLIFPLFPIDFVQQSSEMLVTVFGIDNYQLTLLIFNELTNVVKSFKSQGDAIVFTDQVIQQIIDMIFHQYLELSWTAQGLLINYCGQSPDICFQVLQKIFKPKFKDISSNTVNIFRYIDVGIEIIFQSTNSEMMAIVIDDEVINMINGIITSEDLLAHMNVLDVIKKIMGNNVGYRLIIGRNILDNLYKRLPSIADCPFNTILLPGYLALFGELSRIYPRHTLERYPDFLMILMEHFDSTDIVLRMKTLEIFANFTSVPECKLYLAKEQESVARKALTSMVSLLTSSDTDYQCRSAYAIAHVLSAPRGVATFQEISSINSKWCSTVDITTHVRHMIALPLEDVKMAALSLAVSISTQLWAQKLICGHRDLVDHLLVRSDHWKSCVDLKFELIENLVVGIEEHGVGNLCSETMAANLRQYRSEGKYFSLFQHEMMVDTDV